MADVQPEPAEVSQMRRELEQARADLEQSNNAHAEKDKALAQKNSLLSRAIRGSARGTQSLWDRYVCTQGYYHWGRYVCTQGCCFNRGPRAASDEDLIDYSDDEVAPVFDNGA